MVGSLAVALGEMTLNFTRGKKKYAEHDLLRTPGRADGEGAGPCSWTWWPTTCPPTASTRRRPSCRIGPEKDEAVQVAVAAAIAVPREMTKLALSLLEDLRELAGKCNPWLITDLMAAAWCWPRRPCA